MGSRSLKTSPFERAVIAVLKERLQNADLTIDRLAERAGITRARCYKIFSGTAICTVTDFCAMCNVLGIAGSAVAADAEQRLVGESAGAPDAETDDALAECRPSERHAVSMSVEAGWVSDM